MTWTDTQIALIRALAAYQSAERASAIVNDSIPDQWRKADRLHNELLKLALVCGYEPGGFHRHMSTVEWAQAKANTITRVLPLHLKEAGL